MPTTYTHYRFGQDVKKCLPIEIQKIINNNIDLFNIGLHGPDILFYYKPLTNNNIRKFGSFLHDQKSSIFFDKAAKIINSCSDSNNKDAALSYILGFICHFTLDCEAHKYIEKKIAESTVNHYEIESEFDGYLLSKDNLDPTSTILTNHIKNNNIIDETISMFYDNISSLDINKTLNSMVFYLNHLVVPSKMKRKFIYSLLNISGNSPLCGLIINYIPNPQCKDSNEILMNIYNERIPKAVELIINYCDVVNNNADLHLEFNRTFER